RSTLPTIRSTSRLFRRARAARRRRSICQRSRRATMRKSSCCSGPISRRRAMAALDGAVARLKAQWPQDAPLRQADFSLDDAPPAAAPDVVVSRYGLSRLSHETLAGASAVLAVEATPTPLWRAIFPDLNLRDADSWRAALNGAGFDDVQIREIAGGAWPAQLIAARRAAMEPEEV